MKKSYLIVIIYLAFILIIGCDNSTEPPNISDGSIRGKISIGNYYKIPKNKIRLKLYKESNNNSVLIDSAITDSKGGYIFNNLSGGLYNICFTQDENYTPFRNWQPNDGLCQSVEINSKSKSVIKDFQLFGWHHFTQDTILFEVDTTNWISKSISVKFYNDGVRDTLDWSFDNNIPPWLEINPSNGKYEPENQSDKWLNITINKSTFPVSMWNTNNTITLILRINHQYGINDLVILFRVA